MRLLDVADQGRAGQGRRCQLPPQGLRKCIIGTDRVNGSLFKFECGGPKVSGYAAGSAIRNVCKILGSKSIVIRIVSGSSQSAVSIIIRSKKYDQLAHGCSGWPSFTPDRSVRNGEGHSIVCEWFFLHRLNHVVVKIDFPKTVDNNHDSLTGVVCSNALSNVVLHALRYPVGSVIGRHE